MTLTDDQKLILVVGKGTLPPAIMAATNWVFEQHRPVTVCVEPQHYKTTRAGVEPDLVILTEPDMIEHVIHSGHPEFFMVVCDDAHMKQAESLNGVTAIPVSQVFERLPSAIGQLLF